MTTTTTTKGGSKPDPKAKTQAQQIRAELKAAAARSAAAGKKQLASPRAKKHKALAANARMVEKRTEPGRTLVLQKGSMRSIVDIKLPKNLKAFGGGKLETLIYPAGKAYKLYEMVAASLTEQDVIARRGLSYVYVDALQDELDIGPKQTAEILQVSLRTLQRIQTTGKSLDVVQSGRLLRTAQITKRAKEVLGETEAAPWLHQAQPALNNRIPLDLLETEPGSRAVEQLLGRIDYGVYT